MNNFELQHRPQNPVSIPDASTDQSFTIMFWLGKYESYLYLTFPPKTYERYSRALNKFFFTHFPDKRFTYSVLRCDVEDFKKKRLAEGASPKTVGIEISIIRGFFRWLLAMNADGVLLNPALGVKVERQNRKNSSRSNKATQVQASSAAVPTVGNSLHVSAKTPLCEG